MFGGNFCCSKHEKKFFFLLMTMTKVTLFMAAHCGAECQHGGRCEGGNCVCPDGWGGTHCQTRNPLISLFSISDRESLLVFFLTSCKALLTRHLFFWIHKCPWFPLFANMEKKKKIWQNVTLCFSLFQPCVHRLVRTRESVCRTTCVNAHPTLRGSSASSSSWTEAPAPVVKTTCTWKVRRRDPQTAWNTLPQCFHQNFFWIFGCPKAWSRNIFPSLVPCFEFEFTFSFFLLSGRMNSISCVYPN